MHPMKRICLVIIKYIIKGLQKGMLVKIYDLNGRLLSTYIGLGKTE